MGCKNCCASVLVRAHIVPASFGVLARGDGKHLKQISAENPGPPTQNGIWDPNILCSKCDGILGVYDKYAIEFFRENFSKKEGPSGSFTVDKVDTQKLSRFFAGVLWRASISKRREFSEVSLGPYEERFQSILFGEVAASCPHTVLSKLTSSKFEVSGFYTMPIRCRIGTVNGYTLLLGGMRAVIKVDQLPFPKPFSDLVISGDQVSGVVESLEDTLEFAAMQDVVARRMSRQH